MLSAFSAPLLKAGVCVNFDPNNPAGMEGFFAEPRTAAGRTHMLYSMGSGPAVFVCHEVPGLYRADIDLARRVAKSGFTAYVPLFFGQPGECRTVYHLLSIGLNPASEFNFWLPRTPSAAHWLEPQLAYAHAKSGGKGVAVIGMCLTGSLPLAVMCSLELKAAVLCQPTNPFLLHSSLDLSKSDREKAVASKTDVLALKFSQDPKSPEARWRTLESLFKNRLSELVIDSRKMNMHGISHDAHSILAGSYSNAAGAPTAAAFERVIRFIDARISDPPRLVPYPNPGEPLPPGFCPRPASPA
jgi:dienelactone hydrolase